MGGVPCSSSEQHGPPHHHHTILHTTCALIAIYTSYIHFTHTLTALRPRSPSQPFITLSTTSSHHHNVATATIAPLFCSRRVPRRYWVLSRLRTPTTSSPHLLCRSLRSRVRVRLSQTPRPPPRPRPPRRTSLSRSTTRPRTWGRTALRCSQHGLKKTSAARMRYGGIILVKVVISTCSISL